MTSNSQLKLLGLSRPHWLSHTSRACIIKVRSRAMSDYAVWTLGTIDRPAWLHSGLLLQLKRLLDGGRDDRVACLSARRRRFSKPSSCVENSIPMQILPSWANHWLLVCSVSADRTSSQISFRPMEARCQKARSSSLLLGNPW